MLLMSQILMVVSALAVATMLPSQEMARPVMRSLCAFISTDFLGSFSCHILSCPVDSLLTAANTLSIPEEISDRPDIIVRVPDFSGL